MSQKTATAVAALAEEAVALRQRVGATQREVAEALGLTQPTVSELERGFQNMEKLKAYVELLRDVKMGDLRRQYTGEDKKAEEAKKEKPKAAPIPAIGREISSFIKRHSMRVADFAEMCGVTGQTIYATMRGATVPHPDTVELYRRSMKKYEGENTPTSEQFKPKADAKKVENVSRAGRVGLVVKDGRRINNGDNVAPHLVLDGKTMHVFTLVPGGVFLSYVIPEAE